MCEQLQLGPGEAAWLAHAWLTAPDWTVLITEGPWDDDPLAAFVQDCLKPFWSADETVASFAAMKEHFCQQLVDHRPKLPASFQPQMLLLVEGATEAILIPHFASLLKAQTNSVAIQSCGGANQLLRKYIVLSDITRMPIWCLMDRDADEQISAVQELLRAGKDELHVWQEGEIEDALSADVLLRHLNLFLSEHGAPNPVVTDELDLKGRRTSTLDRVWRSRGLGDFDKVGFARYLADHMTPSEVPEQVKHLIRMMVSHVGARKHVGR